MNLLVREMTTADSPAAMALEEDAFSQLRSVYRPSVELVAVHQDKRSRPGLIAVIGDQMLGSVRYNCVAPAGAGKSLHFMALAVHRDFRHRGIARALIAQLGCVARSSGLVQVSCYTVQETGNVLVFQRLGFSVAARAPAWGLVTPAGKPVTEVLMVQPL